ncbi:MAG: glycosyltransferase family 4 protein [Burkholderiales bacterium]|nr:glycosyltransferase family 4 protein [Burkholderiales bacterium]
MKIARIATVPFFLYNHLRVQIAATVAAGHEVVLVSSGGEESEWLKAIPGVKFREIDIPRKISPLRDLKALWQLFLFFRQEKFDIVHSTTPKAGMLCAIAGFLARTPIRLHTFTGQAWVELHGLVRTLAKAGDWVTARLDTFCYADSASQVDFIATEGIICKEKILVIGSGSLSGVDLNRFDPAKWADSRATTFTELGIPEGYKVITFIGRLTRDKGIEELVAAFRVLRNAELKCILLLIGPGEMQDGSLSNSARAMIDPDIRHIGYSHEPERYLAVTDIFCLPSYREGFGNVAIEAAAMGVPTVGTDIVGLRDAVVQGETGILVQPKDDSALAHALKKLLVDENLRKSMGMVARARAVREFSSDKVNAAVLSEYERLYRLSKA